MHFVICLTMIFAIIKHLRSVAFCVKVSFYKFIDFTLKVKDNPCLRLDVNSISTGRALH